MKILRKIKPKQIGQKTIKDYETDDHVATKANQIDLFVYWAKRYLSSLDQFSPL